MMKQIKKNLLIGAVLGLTNISGANQLPVDTEHEYIVIGTISATEVDDKYNKFLAQHTQYNKNMMQFANTGG